MTDRGNVRRGTSKPDYESLEERANERLRRLLDRAHIGTGVLSDALGVAKETVSRWKSGGQEPGDETLRAIIVMLAERGIYVSIAWIRYGERDGAPKPYIAAPTKANPARGPKAKIAAPLFMEMTATEPPKPRRRAK